MNTTRSHRLGRALALTVLAGALPAIGVATASPASAQTATWYQGNAAVSQSYGCTSFSEPVQSWRGCPSSTRYWHSGLDLTFRGLPGADANGCGSPIYAPVGLTVVAVPGPDRSPNGGFGAYYPVLRLDGSGEYVILGHVANTVVRASQHLNAGALITHVSTQGNSTGCHLHFEVRTSAGGGKWGTDIDPHAVLGLTHRVDRAVVLRHTGPGGYTVAPNGSITAFGGAPVLAPTALWPNQDIVRGAVLRSDDTGGYVLDLYGGLHPFGTAPVVNAPAYWAGWDIARGIVLRSDNTGGYVLDGWGGVHPFGGAPAVTMTGYWSGWDIARGIARYDDGGGYVLDGYGGLHPYGDAPSVTITAYWSGWDIARAVIVTHGGTGPGGYVLDGYGGMHTFGVAAPVTVTGYHPGMDTAVAAALTLNGSSGYELDSSGTLSAVTGFTSGCATCS